MKLGLWYPGVNPGVAVEVPGTRAGARSTQVLPRSAYTPRGRGLSARGIPGSGYTPQSRGLSARGTPGSGYTPRSEGQAGTRSTRLRARSCDGPSHPYCMPLSSPSPRGHDAGQSGPIRTCPVARISEDTMFVSWAEGQASLWMPGATFELHVNFLHTVPETRSD